MFQEMVDRLTPLICKLDTNYRKAMDPGLKVAIALRYMATGLQGTVPKVYTGSVWHTTVSFCS